MLYGCKQPRSTSGIYLIENSASSRIYPSWDRWQVRCRFGDCYGMLGRHVIGLLAWLNTAPPPHRPRRSTRHRRWSFPVAGRCAYRAPRSPTTSCACFASSSTETHNCRSALRQIQVAATSLRPATADRPTGRQADRPTGRQADMISSCRTRRWPFPHDKGGSVIMENMFALSGLGRLILDALSHKYTARASFRPFSEPSPEPHGPVPVQRRRPEAAVWGR